MKEHKNIADWLKDISDNFEKANKKLDKLTRDNPKNEDNTTDKYLTVKEVSALIGLSERTVYRRYYKGKLKSFKMGGLCVFALSEVNRFIKREQEAKAQKENKGLLGKWFGK